jgi:hypothetical protein
MKKEHMNLSQNTSSSTFEVENLPINIPLRMRFFTSLFMFTFGVLLILGVALMATELLTGGLYDIVVIGGCGILGIFFIVIPLILRFSKANYLLLSSNELCISSTFVMMTVSWENLKRIEENSRVVGKYIYSFVDFFYLDENGNEKCRSIQQSFLPPKQESQIIYFIEHIHQRQLNLNDEN